MHLGVLVSSRALNGIDRPRTNMYITLTTSNEGSRESSNQDARVITTTGLTSPHGTYQCTARASDFPFNDALRTVCAGRMLCVGALRSRHGVLISMCTQPGLFISPEAVRGMGKQASLMLRGVGGRWSSEGHHLRLRSLGPSSLQLPFQRLGCPCVEEIPSQRQRYETHMHLLRQLCLYSWS